MADTLGSRAALADAIVALAHEAGRAIMEVYNSDFAVTHKGDASPVTEADVRGEKIILAGLARLDPGTVIVAEEAVAEGGLPQGDPVSWPRFWLVDPLDGTKEFVARNGQFTVNIALIEDGIPTMGVVYAPAIAETYVGFGPGTARRAIGDGPLEPISVRAPAEEGLVVVASRSHRDGRTDEFLSKLKIKDLETAGSSLKFCIIAAGNADLYPRLGTTMEWDTAAGHAVVLAAGGRVDTLDEEPMRYAKPTFTNPHFVVRGAV